MIKELINKYFSGHERTVKARKNIIGSFFINGSNILLGLIMVPLTINYLNPEKYGIWLTLSSIINWFYYFDIGLGNGLRNKFAVAIANNDHKLARIYISTTYATLSIISACLLFIFLVVNPFLDWSKILNTSTSARLEISMLALFVFVSFSIQFVLKLIKMILVADQRNALGNLVDLIGKMVSLLIIIILTHTTTNSLLYLGASLSLTPVSVLLFASICFFSSKYRIYRPSIKFIQFKYMNGLMDLGLKFFAIQIATLVMFATDNLIISQLFGPKDVTPYNIAYRYFGIISMGFNIIIDPYWSAFTDAWARNDINWIKETVRRLQYTVLLFLGLTITMVVFANWVYSVWVGEKIHIPFILTFSMAMYMVFSIFGAVFVYFVNGVGKIKLQFYTSFIATIINIPLSIFFAKYLGLGLAGIIIATTVCILYGPIIAPIQYYKIINNRAKGIWDK